MRRSVKLALAFGALFVFFLGSTLGLLAWTFSGMRPPVEGAISDGVHAVDTGGALAFVVEVNGGVVLIDAGMDPAATAIKAKLEALSDPPVLALLLTHGHGDHVGGCAAFPGVPVVAHEAEVDLVEGRTAALGPIPRMMKNDGSCRVSRVVKHGTRLDYGRMHFEAYHLPGHTAGSVAWLGRRALFLGDAAGGTIEGAMDGALWLFSDDVEQAGASLAALPDQLPNGRVDVLAFGHTGPLDGVKALRAYRP